MSHYFKIKLEGRKGFKFAALEELPRYTCCGEPDTREQLTEALTHEGEPTPVIEWYREVTRGGTVPIGCIALAVITSDRAYGGPEEGGWYYDAETLVREFIVPRAYAARARILLERYCNAMNPERRRYDQEWYKVVRDWEPAKTRPHYC